MSKANELTLIVHVERNPVIPEPPRPGAVAGGWGLGQWEIPSWPYFLCLKLDAPNWFRPDIPATPLTLADLHTGKFKVA